MFGIGGECFVDVRFFGVRGSTPCAHESNRRYGGNTSCVALTRDGHAPIIFDLGTGLRYLGDSQCVTEDFRAHALVTHMHWDHVQGLPFCTRLNQGSGKLDVYGPAEGRLGIGEAFDEIIRPPYFPVRVRDLTGEVNFHTIGRDRFEIDGAVVTAAHIPHIGVTLGYRVEWAGSSVVYIPDHQQPMDGSMDISSEVLALADGADLLIHDSQFSSDEFAARSHWGHCTAEFAVHVAREAGARSLALFHHDPAHDDLAVDLILEKTRELPMGNCLTGITAAAEGLVVPLGTAITAG